MDFTLLLLLAGSACFVMFAVWDSFDDVEWTFFQLGFLLLALKFWWLWLIIGIVGIILVL